MATPTVGFSMGPRDQERVQRLAARYAHGNRSSWLRQAIDLFEEKALFDSLAEIQAQGDRRTAQQGIDRAALAGLVAAAAAEPGSRHAQHVAALIERFQDGAQPEDLQADHESTERFMAAAESLPDA